MICIKLKARQTRNNRVSNHATYIGKKKILQHSRETFDRYNQGDRECEVYYLNEETNKWELKSHAWYFLLIAELVGPPEKIFGY